MYVSALYVYPIKGCPGLSLDRLAVGEHGIARDRVFCLHDVGRGSFISLRERPELATLRISEAPGCLEIRAAGYGTVELSFDAWSGDGPTRELDIWGDRCTAEVVSPDVAAFFSGWLGLEVELLAPAREPGGRVRPDGESNPVGFADSYPLLLTNEGSLEALNTHLSAPISMTRFRPNVVVADGAPWVEDSWQEITIGGVPVNLVKPCPRCVAINVEPETGIREPEPLKVLYGLRGSPAGAMFGQNAAAAAGSELKTGTNVEVVR